MTDKYIYADVEKPFHFWVREGKRWILRDGGSLRDKDATRTGGVPPKRRSPPSRNASA
jgi:hypothetical protein